MRFKLLLFTLLCSLAALLPAKAETLTVYDGTTTSRFLPAYIYYWDEYTRSQFVIPASVLEDMAGGTITALTFYTNVTTLTTTKAAADVYLKEVNYTSISAYETKASSNIVYQGKLTIAANGETTITFTTPFTYNGGNLLIGTENQSAAGWNNVTFYGQTVNGASIAASSSTSTASVSATQRNFIPKTTFTYTPGSSCARPANLAASNVTYDGATLTWTPGDAEQDAWQVVYGTGNFDPDAATPINVTGNATYTLAGLTENTTYYAYVRSNCGGGEVSLWSQVCTFTTSERYARPTNLAVSDITAHTAKASWTGNDDVQSYNLRYRKVLGYNETFSESFETFPGSWTIIDSDGDGNNWTQFNPQNFSDSPFDAYDGSYGVMSRSWQGDALTPDNWLISPQVDLGGVLKYFIVDDGGYQETYRIYVSTTGTNIADFQPITDDLLSPASTTWTERTADLTAFEGQRGYIAFRQYNCTDQDFMIIDAVSIEALTYGEWVEVDGVTSPYTITGLDAETDYVVHVQGVYNEGNSGWSNSVLFTTAEADAMPIDLAVTDVTDTEATATWAGSQDNYNLRYRPYVDPVNKNRFWDLNTSDQLEDWYIVDANNDSYNWQYAGISDDDYVFYSASYINSVGAVTPNNWLITPEVKLGGTLKLSAWGWDSGDYAEVFGVYVGPATFSSNISDYTQVGADITVTHDKTEYEFDLSAYEGTGRIAIVHHNCSNQFYLMVDDISVTVPNAQEDYPWTTINNVTSPYTIESLDTETTYEVQVQGVLDGITTNWTNSVIFTTLEQQAVEATLADICASGQEGLNYTISDQLIAVDYREIGENDVYLWCKDLNQSINKTQIKEGQIDFMKEQGAQVGEWDQSNWVILKLSGQNGVAKAAEAVKDNSPHYITAGTVTGTYVDDMNYMIEVADNNFTVGDVAEFTPNVYCATNFVQDYQNLTADSQGAQTVGNSSVYYFFMNPKINEICTITWAKWQPSDDATGYFTVPSSSGFDGAFNVDWTYNGEDSSKDLVELDDEENEVLYEFTAVIQRNSYNYGPAASRIRAHEPDDAITVQAMDLTAASTINPSTAISTVKAGNGEVVGVYYVNTVGVMSKNPFPGVNVVVTRYSDGSRSSVKKVFK